MSEFTHIVRFLEVKPHQVRLKASSVTDAIAKAQALAGTLPPAARKQSFLTEDTRYDDFQVEALTKRFHVSVEARTIYETDIDAFSQAEAELEAERLWNEIGPADFEFVDFMDTHFEAEQVLPTPVSRAAKSITEPVGRTCAEQPEPAPLPRKREQELLAALADLLGDEPDIVADCCIRCGRDYSGDEDPPDTYCISDDCPAAIARRLITGEPT